MKRNLLSNQILSYARAHPDKKAVIRPDLTGADYSDVSRIYKQTADFFEQLNICESHRFAVLAEDGLYGFLLAFPILEHAVLVPTDNELTADKYEYFFKLLNVDYILTDSAEHTACRAARNSGRGIILFNVNGVMGNVSCRFEVLSAGPKSPFLEQEKAPDSPVAVIKTTSGTTSTPKIVPKSYRNTVDGYIRNMNTHAIGEEDIHLVLTKMHQNHSFDDVVLTLFSGGTAVVTNGFHHKEFIEVMNNNAITWFVTTPAVLNSFSGYLENQKNVWNTPSLRFIRSSGAPLARATKEYYESIFRVPVVQTYGMNESGNITSTWKAPKGFKEGSAGVSTGLDIRVENEEIQVKGSTVFGGYENPEIANEDYFQDGWFRTGDEGYIDEDGYVFITGRIKEMINRGGEKVSPYEIENEIFKHPLIKDAVVFPVPNSYGSEDVAAAVVLRSAASFSLTELREFLHQRAASYKMPGCLYVVNEIPVGPNGKVQRKKLFEQLDKLGCSPDYGELSACASTEPAEASGAAAGTEQILEEIWKKVLKKSHIGYDQDFFALGGDSLSVSQVYAEIEDQFDLQIPLITFFEKKTINGLAEFINANMEFKKKYAYLVPIKISGSKVPLVCIHTAEGEVGIYHDLAAEIDEDRPVYGVRFNKDAAMWRYPLSFEQMASEYAEEIMQMLPEGPYYLCGTCYGGVLAHAVASYMTAAGKSVDLLAMFDSLDPRFGPRFNLFLQRAGRAFREGMSHSLPEGYKIIKRKVNTFLQSVRKRVSISKYRKLDEGKKSAVDWSTYLQEALTYAHIQYQPKYYEGSVYYFLATKDDVKSKESIPFWSKMVAELNIVPMPCRHSQINKKDNSKFLAEKLSELMEG